MNTLLVGYDLNRPGQNYEKLFEFLKSAGTWWHHLDSTWLIKTTASAAELRDSLRTRSLIDGNDEVLVINVTGDAAAWYGFSQSGSKWLKDNL